MAGDAVAVLHAPPVLLDRDTCRAHDPDGRPADRQLGGTTHRAGGRRRRGSGPTRRAFRGRALGPARRRRLVTLERVPVRPRRREDLDRDGALGARGHRVRHVGRDVPGPSGLELALLVADPEPHRSGGQHPDLLVVVGVLGYYRPRVEFDDGERRPLAGDEAANHPVPDPVWRSLAEVAEAAHSRPDFTTPISSHTPRIPESRNPMNEITCSPITCGPFLAKIPIRLDPISPPATTSAITSRLKT